MVYTHIFERFKGNNYSDGIVIFMGVFNFIIIQEAWSYNCSNRSTSTIFGPLKVKGIIILFDLSRELDSHRGHHNKQIQDGRHPY